MEVRKYFVKMDDRFNLDSMRTKMQVIRYDILDGEVKEPVEIMGKPMDLDDIDDFIEEIDDLLGKAMFGKVTGKEYGRIRDISQARQYMRYCTCIAAGMSEKEAAYAFTD